MSPPMSLSVSLSGVDPACPAGCVRANHCVPACLAAWGAAGGSYPQRRTAHAQVETLSCYGLVKRLNKVIAVSYDWHIRLCFPPDQEVEAEQWDRPLCATATEGRRPRVKFRLPPPFPIHSHATYFEGSWINYVLFLSPKDVMLNVKMGVPGERCFYPPEELVWDAARDSSPRSLRTRLAAHFCLSPDSLLLAKHQPDKHAWEEISNWVRWKESFVSSFICLVQSLCILAVYWSMEKVWGEIFI